MKNRKEKKDVPKKKLKGNLFFCIRHLKISWSYLMICIVITVASSPLVSKTADALAQLFDGNFEMSRLTKVILLGAASSLCSIAAYFFQVMCDTHSLRKARDTVWNLMLHTKASYYDKYDPAVLLSTLTVDANAMVSGFINVATLIVQFAAIIGVSAISLFQMNRRLLVAPAVVIALNLVFMIVVGTWERRLGFGFVQQIGNLTGYLTERIKNLTMIKSFTAEDRERNNGYETAGKLYGVARQYSFVQALYGALTSFSGIVTTTITVLWGCYMLRIKTIDVPGFIAFQTYMGLVNVGMTYISFLYVVFQDINGRTARLAELIRSPKEDLDANADKTEILPGDICFKDVSFSYGEDASETLHSLSFTIPYHGVTAIVGPSGSGKSTVVKLLERLYEPSKGSISIGNQDIKDINLRAWRNKIAYVVQDAGIFSGTLREVLSYCVAKEPSDQDLWKVLKEVNMDDFVRGLPDDLDAKIGSWGGTISGGQRQRFVIARALLQNADIYIFDEPTSALDPKASDEISSLILHSFSDKTVIIISHELNYIAAANQIVVINEGNLLGTGEHSELMKDVNVYRNLVEEQSYQEVFGA